MRFLARLSGYYLLFSSSMALSVVGFVDTLKKVENVYYDTITDFLNETTPCLDVLPETEAGSNSAVGFVDTLFTIKDHVVVGDSVRLFGWEFADQERPWVSFVADGDFRELVANLLVTKDKGLLLNYNVRYFAASTEFYLVNYDNHLGIVVYFEQGTTNPVVLFSDHFRSGLNKESLFWNESVQRVSCRVR